MTIQLSVTLWTVICFCVLALVLRRLLFVPLLGVMDARKEKIAQAQAKKARFAQLEQEHQALLAEKEAAFRSAQQKSEAQRLEAIRSESRRAVEAAREERVQAVDRFREKTDAEREEILRTLGAHAQELAQAFAESVVGK